MPSDASACAKTGPMPQTFVRSSVEVSSVAASSVDDFGAGLAVVVGVDEPPERRRERRVLRFVPVEPSGCTSLKSTSSMTAISAASPARWPSFTMRV